MATSDVESPTLFAAAADVVAVGLDASEATALLDQLLAAGADVNARTADHESLVGHVHRQATDRDETAAALALERRFRAQGFADRLDDAPHHAPTLAALRRACDGLDSAQIADLELALCAGTLRRWRSFAEGGGLPATIPTSRGAVALDASLPERAFADVAGSPAGVVAASPAASPASSTDADLDAALEATAQVLVDAGPSVSAVIRQGFLALHNLRRRRLGRAPELPPQLVMAQALAALDVADQSNALRRARDAIASTPASSASTPAAAEATWAVRPNSTTELLRFGAWAAGLALALAVALAPLTFFLDSSYAVGLILFFASAITFGGLPLAFVLTRRQSRRPGADCVQLFADRLVLQQGATSQAWPRDAQLEVDSFWFQGIAGQNVYAGGSSPLIKRGYAASVFARVASPAGEVVFFADGDVEPAYGSSIRRRSELDGVWPGARRVRMWPADLVAMVEALGDG